MTSPPRTLVLPAHLCTTPTPHRSCLTGSKRGPTTPTHHPHAYTPPHHRIELHPLCRCCHTTPSMQPHKKRRGKTGNPSHTYMLARTQQQALLLCVFRDTLRQDSAVRRSKNSDTTGAAGVEHMTQLTATAAPRGGEKAQRGTPTGICCKAAPEEGALRAGHRLPVPRCAMCQKQHREQHTHMRNVLAMTAVCMHLGRHAGGISASFRQPRVSVAQPPLAPLAGPGRVRQLCLLLLLPRLAAAAEAAPPAAAAAPCAMAAVVPARSHQAAGSRHVRLQHSHSPQNLAGAAPLHQQ